MQDDEIEEKEQESRKRLSKEELTICYHQWLQHPQELQRGSAGCLEGGLLHM